MMVVSTLPDLLPLPTHIELIQANVRSRALFCAQLRVSWQLLAVTRVEHARCCSAVHADMPVSFD
jgi:hypothetical protein